MEEAPVSPVWMDRLLLFASMMKYETIMPYKEEVKNSMPGCRKPISKRMTDRRLQPMFSSLYGGNWRYDGGWGLV